jgi:hypothetical protein
MPLDSWLFGTIARVLWAGVLRGAIGFLYARVLGIGLLLVVEVLPWGR